MSTKVKCPECRSKATPIMYGLPSPKGFKKAQKGEVFLGGCMIWAGQPDYHCPSCQNSFREDGQAVRKDWFDDELSD